MSATSVAYTQETHYRKLIMAIWILSGITAVNYSKGNVLFRKKLTVSYITKPNISWSNE